MTYKNDYNRCVWARNNYLMRSYHDNEWGVPEHNSRALWEKLILDIFQSGLSWITVLSKRNALRDSFAGFDPIKIVSFSESDIMLLLNNPNIIRHRGKINATICGAKIYCKMADHGEDFNTFCWSFTDGKVLKGDNDIFPTKIALSERISKELKDLNFKFVGPTIVYAWLQAIGIFNDHSVNCFRREQV
ncbi:MAG: DNA-3-methyladenine glycosylase I [Rhodospirillaceae bacterium]|jgi:DNA-3-methyladenine glycosylase I|nr:DNA-3-methyladenine glycosylase I [Rhodospirillaceae bacterium]